MNFLYATPLIWIVFAGFGPVFFCGITDRPFTKNIAGWSFIVYVGGLALLLTAITMVRT